MKHVWFIPLLAILFACKQEDARPQPVHSTASAARAAREADTRPVIVCFGDSLTAGFGVDPGRSFPDLLQQQLDQRGYRYHVLNFGQSGDTTQDGLDRISLVTMAHPRIVLLEFGANDGLRGQPVPNMEKNLAQMIDTLQKTGTRVVLAGITLPPNYGPDYIQRFDAVYPRLAKKYDIPLLPFLLEGAAGHPDLMQQDGLHPNTAGTRLVEANVWRVIEPLLHKD